MSRHDASDQQRWDTIRKGDEELDVMLSELRGLIAAWRFVTQAHVPDPWDDANGMLQLAKRAENLIHDALVLHRSQRIYRRPERPVQAGGTR